MIPGFARVAVLSLGVLVSLASPILAADKLADHAQSLDRIPAGASFYAAWVGMGEDFRAMQQTNAWKRLLTIPGVQLGLMQMQTQWQFPADPRVQMVKDWVEGEEGQDALALLTEMGSEEVFLYGGEGWGRLIEVLAEANGIRDGMRFNKLFEAIEQASDADSQDAGAYDDEEDEQADDAQLLQGQITSLLEDYGEDLVVPDLVIGFRVRDPARATAVLDRYEPLLRGLLTKSAAPIAERLQRVSRGGADLLTLRFDEGMLPWDQIEDEWTASPELLESIRESLDDKSAAFAIGIVGNFVVLSMGGSNDHLLQAADGKSDEPLLVNRDEMQRVSRHADQRVRSIGYVSEKFLRQADSTRADLRGLADLSGDILDNLGVGGDRRDAIEQDAQDLVDWLLDYLPEPGAVAGVSFATPRGYESYTYDWKSVTAIQDPGKPLTLVDQLGADPLGWLVSRSSYSTDRFIEMTRLMGRVKEHAEAFVEPKTDPQEWQEYVEVRDRLMPLVGRLVSATRDHLIPGLADGQTALVFDASVSSDSWLAMMPPSDSELPMPSLALVLGVSDAERVKAAAEEYFGIAQDAINLAHEMKPDEVPPFPLPGPLVNKGAAGTTYRYELPPQAGADPRIALNAGLSDSALVLSLLPEVSESLLSGLRPAIDGPVAAKLQRPLHAAGYFSFARFNDALRPWIDYGVKIGVEQAGDEGAQAAAMVGFIKPQVDQLLDVLKAWDSVVGVTYREEGAWVTHSETRFIDLEN